ncbi:MAG: transposase [Muribaculaceae bacterium]|nr:transposase [Muribaculaceae bacterium]
MIPNSDYKFYKEEFNHRYTRRDKNHDYYAPFIYHVILKKDRDCGPFGMVKGDPRIGWGTKGCAYVARSPIGKTIARELSNLQEAFPAVKIYQYCIMPDHVHILLRILERSDYHLGDYINRLKGAITRQYSQTVFKPEFTDKPLYHNHSLNGLYVYIRDNPRRLAMRIRYPQFFQRVRSINIAGRECEAYGNFFLLRNPDKDAVKISRHYNSETLATHTKRWLYGAATGTILVSPFISPTERAIRDEAIALGGHFIFITHEAFPERFKPRASDFDLCACGRLLIISLRYRPGTPLSRAICMEMNALAASIAAAY